MSFTAHRFPEIHPIVTPDDIDLTQSETFRAMTLHPDDLVAFNAQRAANLLHQPSIQELQK